jgi:hypothetical protein
VLRITAKIGRRCLRRLNHADFAVKTWQNELRSGIETARQAENRSFEAYGMDM